MALLECELDQSTDMTPYTKFLNGSVTIRKNLAKDGTTESYTVPHNGYYGVSALNTTTSGSCTVYMMSSPSTYIATNSAGTGTYLRATVPCIPFKQGATIYARAWATSEAYIYELT